MNDIGRTPAQARHALRSSLLSATLAHASTKSRFYAALWGERVSAVRGVEDLPLLPILRKEDVVERFDDILCGATFPALVQHTTGTTGAPLRVFRSADEVAFIREFFGRVAGLEVTTPPIVLHLADLYHGPSLEIPSHAYPLRAGMTDDILLKEAVRLLTSEHAVPGGRGRVSTIVGLVPYLKTLTTHLIETGFDFSTTAVEVICPLCTIVTPRWRSLLSSTWSAAVIDRYSLAEIFGGATRCLRCESFHFDPVVVPEVVDVSSHEPLRSGVGALVLTSLYPFVQMQPMVRYWTGDLVEISTDSCQPDLSVRFKGRVSSTPLMRRGDRHEVVVCPVDVYEALDDLPDVAFSDRFVDIRAVRDHSAAGAIRFRMSVEECDGPALLRLEIELRYSPHLYRNRCEALRAEIGAELRRRSALLSSGAASLSIEFSPPGTIPPFSLKI